MAITSIINSITKTEQSLSQLPLRLIAGLIFSAHGAQKLFAWFGGYAQTGQASGWNRSGFRQDF